MKIEEKDCVITHNEAMEVVIISWLPDKGPSGDCIVTYRMREIDTRGDGHVTPREIVKEFYDFQIDEINIEGSIVTHEIEQHFIRIAKNYVQ